MLDDVEERRSVERRVFELEQKMSQLLMTSALTDERVKGLGTTLLSRHSAFEKGQDLILERLKSLEEVKDKADGALFLIRILGWTGIIGGIVAIIRTIKG